MNWDAHKKLKADYERHGPIFDQLTAVLLADLKQRDLLDDTLVLWTTEFGRMPTRQEGTAGRDHKPEGFTVWLMGAGVKVGVSYGATDELGRRPVEDVTAVYELYATVLQAARLGFPHARLLPQRTRAPIDRCPRAREWGHSRLRGVSADNRRGWTSDFTSAAQHLPLPHATCQHVFLDRRAPVSMIFKDSFATVVATPSASQADLPEPMPALSFVATKRNAARRIAACLRSF